MPTIILQLFETFCVNLDRISIHPLSLTFHSCRSLADPRHQRVRRWVHDGQVSSPSQGQHRETYSDRQAFTLTFTPLGNSKLPINQTCMSLNRPPKISLFGQVYKSRSCSVTTCRYAKFASLPSCQQFYRCFISLQRIKIPLHTGRFFIAIPQMATKQVCL